MTVVMITVARRTVPMLAAEYMTKFRDGALNFSTTCDAP